jgi:hypothetical protein
VSGFLHVNGGNGYGTTNGGIRRFTNVSVNTVAGITYADSASLGASLTCTVAGIYTFAYSDQGGASDIFGFSLNSNQLSTVIQSINANDILAITTTIGTGTGLVVVTTPLIVGDVVRPHGTQSITGTSAGWIHMYAYRNAVL